jgi:preprotein translocase subunit SecB
MSSPLAPHPISLETVVFTKSVVLAIPEHQPVQGKGIAPPENNIHVEKVAEEEGAYAATMHTTLNKERDKGSPYFIEMECMGVLRADKSLSAEEALKGVTITAHSVLFGAIREATAWITARQPYGPVLLGLSVLRPKSQEDQQASGNVGTPISDESTKT